MDNGLQLGVGGIFVLMVLDKVFSFLKAKKEEKTVGAVCEHDDGEEGNYASKILISRIDFKRLIESMETNTRAIKELLEHEEDEKRILHRVEKQLDRLN